MAEFLLVYLSVCYSIVGTLAFMAMHNIIHEQPPDMRQVSTFWMVMFVIAPIIVPIVVFLLLLGVLLDWIGAYEWLTREETK